MTKDNQKINSASKQVRGPRREPVVLTNEMKKGNPLKTLKRLLKYIVDGYMWQLIIVIVCILLSSLATVVSTLFIKNLIDDFIVPLSLSDSPDFSNLFLELCKMSMIFLVGVMANYLFNRLMINICQGTLKRIRDNMFNHMESLPIKFFDTHAHGDIMSVYTNDTDTLRQMISQGIPQLIDSAFSIVIVFSSMIVLSIPLTIIVVIMIIAMFFITKVLGGKSALYFKKQQQNLGKVNGYIEEMIEGQKVVKVFCHEEEAKKDFDKLNDELFDSSNKANTLALVLMPIMGNMGNFNYVITGIVGSVLAIKGIGSLTLGTIASFITLTKSFNRPITQISQQFNSIIMALAGAERIFKLLDENKETDDGYVELVNATVDKDGNIHEVKNHTGIWAWKHPHKAEGTVTYSRLLGDVVFNDVDFGYTDQKIVLHNIKLYAKPGQKIAFVGATGAGKTTITNLINRFYDIQDGKIRYDGININKIKKDDLRRSLGIVLQDTHLFTGTIKENIKYGNLDATDEQVISAAKLANADLFIRHLPKGYDTVITGDGGSLSQGQRQLLAIARAAIADPPVLILDEATSSIDTRTEKIVQDGMDKLMHGRTVFVIAHRLSTVQNSDVIMVLDQGRIIERGNHDELIKQKGRYYELYTGAFELS